MKLIGDEIEFESTAEQVLADERLEQGKCALCGQEDVLTPGLTLGRKCLSRAIGLKEVDP